MYLVSKSGVFWWVQVPFGPQLDHARACPLQCGAPSLFEAISSLHVINRNNSYHVALRADSVAVRWLCGTPLSCGHWVGGGVGFACGQSGSGALSPPRLELKWIA